MYNISTDCLNKISKFESYVEGTLTIKDYGRLWCVLIDSNLCTSINVMIKGDDHYTFWNDSGNLLQSGETRECKVKNLEGFVNLVMDDITGEVE